MVAVALVVRANLDPVQAFGGRSHLDGGIVPKGGDVERGVTGLGIADSASRNGEREGHRLIRFVLVHGGAGHGGDLHGGHVDLNAVGFKRGARKAGNARIIEAGILGDVHPDGKHEEGGR